MTDDARPLNYTAVKTVARDTMSRFATVFPAPTSGPEIENRKRAAAGPAGSYPPCYICHANVHTDMAITNSDTTDHSTTISLAGVLERDDDGKRRLPETATADIDRVPPDVIEITGAGHTFTVERCLRGIAEVTLRDGEAPKEVPGWVAAVTRDYFGDVTEVVLV